MKGHPGGEAHSLRMLELSGLEKGAKILDMGAGSGETVLLLQRLGYDAQGIDLEPGAEIIRQGDFLNTGYGDGFFDAVLSQCAFFVSGNIPAALLESHRILKHGGLLLLSDVCFMPGDGLRQLVENCGFSVLHQEDMTALWREYYIEALWAGTADCVPCGKKCTYQLLIGRKE